MVAREALDEREVTLPDSNLALNSSLRVLRVSFLMLRCCTWDGERKSLLDKTGGYLAVASWSHILLGNEGIPECHIDTSLSFEPILSHLIRETLLFGTLLVSLGRPYASTS